MRRPDFYESQKFNQLWLWIIILAITGVIVGITISRVYQVQEAGGVLNTPHSEGGLIAATLINVILAAGLIWLFKVMTLETRIDHFGIHYRYFPFVPSWKTLTARDILAWKVKKYFPLGYGIRWGLGVKTLNVKGNMGLELSFAKGPRLMLGTQKPEEIKLAMLALYNSDSHT